MKHRYGVTFTLYLSTISERMTPISCTIRRKCFQEYFFRYKQNAIKVTRVISEVGREWRFEKSKNSHSTLGSRKKTSDVGIKIYVKSTAERFKTKAIAVPIEKKYNAH